MISIVIPTYNEAAFVGRLLESLAQQKINEVLDIVVVDNMSRDRTREVVEAFRKQFPTLLIADGGTPSVGRNKGARLAIGDPIFFMDADLDLRDPAFLRRSSDLFRSRRLAAATFRLAPLSERLVDRALVAVYNSLLAPAAFVRPLGAMCIVATRSAFELAGGYPEDVVMAEDHDFVLRCSRVGRYRILPGYVHFSVRRFEKEGRLPLVIKYCRAAILRLFSGPIKNFDYEFGCFDE